MTKADRLPTLLLIFCQSHRWPSILIFPSPSTAPSPVYRYGCLRTARGARAGLAVPGPEGQRGQQGEAEEAASQKRLRASRAAGLAHPQRHRTLAPRILPVRAAAGRPAEHHPVQALQEADAAVGGVPAHPRVPAQEEREGAEEEGAEGGEPQGARGAAEGGAGRGRGGARRRRRRVGGGREPSRRRGGGIGGGGVGDGQEERRGGGQEAQGRGRGRQGADQEEDQEGARGGQAQGGQAQGPRRRGEAVRRAAAQRADVRAQPDVQEPRHGRQARRAGPQPALRRAAGGLPEEEPGQAAEGRHRRQRAAARRRGRRGRPRRLGRGDGAGHGRPGPRPSAPARPARARAHAPQVPLPARQGAAEQRAGRRPRQRLRRRGGRRFDSLGRCCFGRRGCGRERRRRRRRGRRSTDEFRAAGRRATARAWHGSGTVAQAVGRRGGDGHAGAHRDLGPTGPSGDPTLLVHYPDYRPAALGYWAVRLVYRCIATRRRCAGRVFVSR